MESVVLLKKNSLLICLLISSLISLFICQVSFARPLVEVKTFMGAIKVNPSELNEGYPQDSKINFLNTFGLDLLAQIQSTPWFVGVRYDALSRKVIDADRIHEFTSRDFYFIGNYRKFLNNEFFIGANFGLAFWHSTEEFIKISPVNSTYRAEKVRSALAGIETGWLFDIYVLSVEGTYQYFKAEDFRDDNASYLALNSSRRVAQMSGPALRFHLGVQF